MKTKKYKMGLMEGISDTIAKIFNYAISKKVIAQAQDIVDEYEDDNMKKTLDQVATSYDKFERAVKEFCRKNPNHIDCKDSKNSSFKLQQYRYSGK